MALGWSFSVSADWHLNYVHNNKRSIIEWNIFGEDKFTIIKRALQLYRQFITHLLSIWKMQTFQPHKQHQHYHHRHFCSSASTVSQKLVCVYLCNVCKQSWILLLNAHNSIGLIDNLPRRKGVYEPFITTSAPSLKWVEWNSIRFLSIQNAVNGLTKG